MMQTRAPCQQKSLSRALPARASRVIVRAVNNPQHGADPRSFLVAALATASLLVSGAPSAQASPEIVQKALESEQTIQAEGRQLEYILQQQSIAKQAQIEARRQQLNMQKSSIQAALQQKLTEQRANALSAKAKGDGQKLSAIEAEAAQLEETVGKVQVAAAKAEAALSRVEMLEKARTVAGRQNIRKAVAEADSEINQALDKVLESSLTKQLVVP